MKILHTSDLHIGSPLTSRLSQEKIRERKAELLSCFEKMIEEAVYQRVRVFIIAGDLFDSERITKSTAERVLGAMARYPYLDFLYLPGNHEKNALLECGVSLPENLKIFGLKLPIKVSKAVYKEYVTIEYQITEQEASKKAEKALSLWWEKEADGEIVSIDCETEIKNNVYRLKAHVVINKNIALRQEIQFNYPNKPF